MFLTKMIFRTLFLFKYEFKDEIEDKIKTEADQKAMDRVDKKIGFLLNSYGKSDHESHRMIMKAFILNLIDDVH